MNIRNLSKYLLISTVVCLMAACKKSQDNTTNGIKVTITGSAPFSWDIDEYIAGQNSTTIDTAGINSNAVSYSFRPIIGQTVSLYAKSASISDLTAVITYNGETLGPVNISSDPSYGTVVSFDYVVTN